MHLCIFLIGNTTLDQKIFTGFGIGENLIVSEPHSQASFVVWFA